MEREHAGERSGTSERKEANVTRKEGNIREERSGKSGRKEANVTRKEGNIREERAEHQVGEDIVGRKGGGLAD
eukprot:358316-Chlamydomonas_euryale.AAC.5